METKKIVVTKEDMRLDEIVFQEYGTLKHFEEILELNIGLFVENRWEGSWSRRTWIKGVCSVYLPLGAELLLPIFEECKRTEEVEASTLW